MLLSSYHSSFKFEPGTAFLIDAGLQSKRFSIRQRFTGKNRDRVRAIRDDGEPLVSMKLYTGLQGFRQGHHLPHAAYRLLNIGQHFTKQVH
jgi:hypothetical protein